MRQLRRFRDMTSLTLEALDGEVGSVEDLYLDDRSWTVRYLIVKTGGWLLGRYVLIAPASVVDIDDAAGRLRVNLTQEQIEQSPPIDRAKTVSRAYEEAFFQHFRLAPYWNAVPGPSPTVVPYPGTVPPAVERASEPHVPSAEQEATHVQSAQDVGGYRIQAHDGQIGHVEDVVIDDEEWMVRYLEVDTRNWLPGKKVLVPTSHITGIDWPGQSVSLTLTRQAIESAPPYNPSELITPDYEVRLFKYYSQVRRS